MTTLYPTHTCFDDALDYLGLVATAEGRRGLRGLALVHGICLVPEGESFVGAGQPGDRFAHAWVESGGRVIQGAILDGERVYFSILRVEFFEKWRVQDFTRYTPRQAMRQNRLSNHFGPWESKYEALTRDRGNRAAITKAEG